VVDNLAAAASWILMNPLNPLNPLNPQSAIRDPQC